jgi:hypothetical protein
MQLLGQYNYLLANKGIIPCASLFATVPDIHKVQTLEKAMMQRLQHKAAIVQELLSINGQDWEETTYQWLATSMGFKLNAQPFLQLAKAVPLKLLQKHRDNLLQMEALLFGQAGFLDETSTDIYVQALQKEYKFLGHKYQLADSKLSAGQWKFAKLRPVNFPTLRIAHLAALLQVHQNLFSLLIHTNNLKSFADILSIPVSGYWRHHYTFGKETASTSQLGKENVANLMINTVIPILTCYAGQKDKYAYIDKAIGLLECLPAEDNYITRLWKELHLPVKNAFDAQAAIELHNNFCLSVKCLSCPVGVFLVKGNQKKDVS